MEQEPKTPRARADDLISLLVSDWRPSPQQVVWGIRIVLLFVLILGILTLVGRPFDITLWQWLDLLIIPVVLAVGGYLFTRSENRASRVAAEQRAQDEALQAYLDQMGQMLLDKERPLRRSKEGDEERTLARARTLTVLGRLDGERKRSVLQFLSESNLLVKERPIVNIAGADMRDASLHYAHLNGTDLGGIDLSDAVLFGGHLSGTDLSHTNLSRADLRFSQMTRTDLYKADLSEADLTGAVLLETNLRRTDLRSADLSLAGFGGVDLSGADLNGAKLSGARLNGNNFSDADLSNADLSNADLSNAKGISNEELERQAATLEGATMPNLQKYEDWLKDKKGSEED
jgi:uncharacterized protein YjbI with pentapeptide repeats